MAMNPTKKIIVVGAGVFGLSTALHLAERGYQNVHIFDEQPYDKNRYEVSQGCVAASCDENKIIRGSYGNRTQYQALAFEAIDAWNEWNRELASAPSDHLPQGLTSELTLWDNCGLLRLSDRGLEDAEKNTQKNFPPRLRHTQYRVSDEERRKDALKNGIPFEKIDPFDRIEKELPTDGYLDTTAGLALASKACSFALYKCVKAGVKTHFGSNNGLKSLIQDGDLVHGIVTIDGLRHEADLVILACGSWTPSLLPAIENIVEPTSGTVITFKLPQDRQDLWEKYSSSKFPVWCFNMTTYRHGKNPIAGIFGFPRTPEGIIKLCFTGAQWTNYDHISQGSGREISYPKTDSEKVPEEALDALRTFCEENLPDLAELEIDTLRLCWYCDSVDESFLIDYVPSKQGLMVCSGASGHGFKFLPILGRHVVDVVERKETEYTRLFQWRDVPHEKKGWLEKGPSGWQNLAKQKLVGKNHWNQDMSWNHASRGCVMSLKFGTPTFIDI